MGLDKSTKSSKLWSELGKWVFKTFLLLARYESITMKTSLSNSPLKRLSLSLMQTVKGRAMNMYEEAVKQVRDIYNRFLRIRTNC